MHATVSHTLFISSVHFENVGGLLFALFLGQRNRKFLLPEETKDSFQKKKFPTRKSISDTYLSDEKLWLTCSKEKRNSIMNGISIVSTTGSTGRRAYSLITRLPFYGKTSMYMYETLDKKHKNKFLSTPSTWVWSEQPTSLTVLSASERCTTTKNCVPTFTSTNNILNTRKRYYLYSRNWNSKWNE